MAQRKRPVNRRVRIIGGKWKGRKLDVADRPGLRPTMDRVRETVFSWLSADLADSHVLDLFAGTGALAFEALSRGAAFATLVERDRATARVLRSAAARLDAHCEVHVASATAWLRRQRHWHWNLVFLDPPFGTRAAQEALALLRERDVLVYLEEADTPHGTGRGGHAVHEDTPSDVPGWETVRQGRAGACRFRLLRPVAPVAAGAASTPALC